MKILKLSLIATSLLLIGCGGGGSDTPALTEVKTVKAAKTSYKAIGSFESIDISKKNNEYQKLSQEIQKSESANCKNGGTVGYDLSDDQTFVTISYSNCQIDSKYYNGSMTMHQTDKSNYTITMSDYTYRDIGGEQYMNITLEESKSDDISTTKLHGVINKKDKNNNASNMTFNNMILTSKDIYSDSWYTVNGGINLASKCVTGNYQFKTEEKLVNAKDGTNNIESGILDINGATYTFNNPDVTIKIGEEETIMTQTELNKATTSNNCSSSS